jgi:hypothetical protein
MEGKQSVQKTDREPCAWKSCKHGSEGGFICFIIQNLNTTQGPATGFFGRFVPHRGQQPVRRNSAMWEIKDLPYPLGRWFESNLGS